MTRIVCEAPCLRSRYLPWSRFLFDIKPPRGEATWNFLFGYLPSFPAFGSSIGSHLLYLLAQNRFVETLKRYYTEIRTITTMKIPQIVLATVVANSCANAWVFDSSPFSSPFALTTLTRPLISSPSSLLRKELMGRGFTQTSPRYEITDNDQEFKLAVDIPGMKAEDVKVSVDDDAKMLSITGEREAKGDYYEFKSSFSQSFSLDPAIDLDHFTANLNEGVLVVSAPKDPKKVAERTRTIPVIEQAAAKTTEEKEAIPEVKDDVKHEEETHAGGTPIEVQHG